MEPGEGRGQGAVVRDGGPALTMTRAQLFAATEIIRAAMREVLKTYTLELEHCNGRVEVNPFELERLLLAHVVERIAIE